MPRLLVPLCAALLAPLPAGAAGLGEIELHSRLGEPLRAVIPLTIETGENLPTRCFALAAPGQGDLPAVTRGKLRLIQRGRQQHLQITGRDALNEPLAVVAVRIDCGVDLQREYVLMPEAPIGPAAQPIPPAAATASSPDSGEDAPVRSPRRPPRPPREAAAATPAPPPPPPAPRVAPPGGDRLLLGAAETAGSSATTQELEELDQRLLRMETTLHSLHQEVEKMDRVLALAQQSAAGAGPASVAVPPPVGRAQEAARRAPSAGQWLELLLSALLGGVSVVTVASLVARWRERRAAA